MLPCSTSVVIVATFMLDLYYLSVYQTIRISIMCGQVLNSLHDYVFAPPALRFRDVFD